MNRLWTRWLFPLRRTWRAWATLVLFLPGCVGSGSPFRFGSLPATRVHPTHAKPALWGYYWNFDPHAKQLTLNPPEAINPVRKQHVLIATVCDEHGNGRRNRRVEWHVTGVGHIVEVDESGHCAGRGYMVDGKYAVSFTNFRPHTITRGNDDPNDDIVLKPGQTWCVITSAEEGDTNVTCYAPGIHDWEKHKVFAVKHWVDAQPFLPPPAVNPCGQPHTLTTRIARLTDGSPVHNYRVRYRIVDGPPAVLDPGGAPQVEVVSDHYGNASCILRQVQPAVGVNRIAIEVVRPSDKPTGKELVLAVGETTKTWVSPQLSIQKVGPATAVVGSQVPYQIIVTNTGSVATRGVTIRDTLIDPPLRYRTSNPLATQQGPNLFWSFGTLQPQQSVIVEIRADAVAAGTVTNCAEAMLAEGIAAKSCCTTQIVAGALEVTKTGPPTAVVGQAVTFQITVTNRGAGPALGVVVTDAFDPGFAHQSGVGPVQMQVGNLGPGEGRAVPITLVPRTIGKLTNRVTATAAGGLTASAQHVVDVSQPQLTIQKTGPKYAIVGAPIEFDVVVRNAGQIPATNVILRDTLPTELRLQGAPAGAVAQPNGFALNLGTIQPNENKAIKIVAVPILPTPSGGNACNMVVMTADGGIQQQASACVEIRGVPGVGTEMIDRLDPVAVNGETTYTIRVTNQGSTVLDGVILSCQIPDGMEFVDAEPDKTKLPHAYDAATHRVNFGAVNGLPPKQQLLYQVQVKAVRPGDKRFKALITAAQLKEPVVIEESTRVYDPATGQIDGAKAAEPKKPEGATSINVVDVIAVPVDQPTAPGKSVAPVVKAAEPQQNSIEANKPLESPTFELPLPPLPPEESEKKPEPPTEKSEPSPPKVASNPKVG